MSAPPITIEALAEKIPSELYPRSGKVFYSGRQAFSAQFPLYVLGLNPGGDPSQHETETIGNHTAAVLRSYPKDWSAYRDESWKGRIPGSYGMAPRVLHLFTKLRFKSGQVPCSNLVFVRSRRERDIHRELTSLKDLCWTFHEFAIERLHPQVILCFGKTVGRYVRNQVGANTLRKEFVETNERKWRSQWFDSSRGPRVVVATHPSVADWRAPNTDPTQLILEALR